MYINIKNIQIIMSDTEFQAINIITNTRKLFQP